MSRPKLSKLKEKYTLAKSAKVGEKVCCPSCGTEFDKTNYQQAFCKSKPGTECKDYYWNNVTPTKRNNKTRISPANARFHAMYIAELPFNVVGTSGKVTGRTSEGYRIVDGVAYDEWGEPVYNVDRNDMDAHPHDLDY